MSTFAEQATALTGTSVEIREITDAWLRQALQEALQGAAGGVLVSEVVQAARGAGTADSSLRRAAARIGVVRSKGGMRCGWSWSLPAASGARAAPAAFAGEGDQRRFENQDGAAGEGKYA